MSNDHDRFDALAGAVMLGEATEAERALFEAHAATCEPCRSDAACAPVFVRAVERARAAETWRPSIGNLVLGRIRDSRTSRFRITIGALGWAVAISIVFNLALANGVSTHLGLSSPSESTSDVSAMTIELESPAPRAVASVAERGARVAVVPHRPRLRAMPKAFVNATKAASVAPLPAPQDARADDVPDVLAGLDIDGTDGSKHVAVEPRPICSPAPADGGATDAAPPCVPPEGKH